MRSSFERWVMAGALLAQGAGCSGFKPRTDRRDAVADQGADSATDATQSDGATDASADSALDGDSCWDPTGLGGRGCYRCAPTTREQRLNACTTARCEGFDNSRLALDGGALPALPSAPDASSADTGVATDAASDGGRADSGVPPLCTDLARSPIIYATGSSAVTLFLGRIAQLMANAATPYTIVYRSAGSCVGVSAMISPTGNALSGQAIVWNPDTSVDPSSAAAQIPCTIDPSTPTYADVGFSDVFATTCVSLPSGLDPGLRDFFGPIQVMNFVVPQNSSARTISGEAAYLVYGFGAAGPSATTVSPWDDATRILQRNAQSGTQAMIAATIGVPREQWRGVTNAGSGNVRDGLIASGGAGAAAASRAIGILSSDFADGLRDRIRILAYQDFGQRCGFWPDSDVTSTDKRNVRDGHFPMWGPLHVIARVNGAGVPTRPGVQTLVDLINGVNAPSGFDIVDVYARRGLIPQCAMRVTRNNDGGELRSFTPVNSCGCYFEERATGLNPPPGCTACDRPADCPASAPNCNRFAGQTRGYCEP